MQCPYCGKEMEAGYIQSSHAMFWGKDPSMWDGHAVRLNKLSLKALFDGYMVEARRCVSCHKLIVDLENTED